MAAVIIAALHVPEDQAFIRLARSAEPWWRAAAGLFQAATRLAQGGRRDTTRY